MKKTIFTIAVILSVFSLTFISCDNEDKEPLVPTGSFEIYLDGTQIAKASSLYVDFEYTKDEVEMIGSMRSGSKSDIWIGPYKNLTVRVSQIPREVGESIDIKYQGGVEIEYDGIVELETYEGTMTRESASKVSFNGLCGEPNFNPSGQPLIKITGFIESDYIKQIKH